MEHAQTIAMATDLLAEGRAEDVVQMVDPLLTDDPPSPQQTGQVRLRTLRARIEIVDRGRPDAGRAYLPALSAIDDLCTCVRAQVALWRGWACAQPQAEAHAPSRALYLLNEADALFQSIHDPQGRCWALLGRARAYERLEEYAQVEDTLDASASLLSALDSSAASRWDHQLRSSALHAAGQFHEALAHADALFSLGEDVGDVRMKGTAQASKARHRLALGMPPSDLLQTADRALSLLQRISAPPPEALEAAYTVQIRAHLRQGTPAAARDVLATARDRLPESGALQCLAARVYLHDGAPDEAASVLSSPSGPRHECRVERECLYGRAMDASDAPDAARRWYERARRHAAETGNQTGESRALLHLASLTLDQDDLSSARASLDTAQDRTALGHALPLIADGARMRGRLHRRSNRSEKADAAFRQSEYAASLAGDAPRQQALDAYRPFSSNSADRQPPTSALPEELPTLLSEGTPPHPLLAAACHEALSARLPDSWIALCRDQPSESPTLVREHGPRPDGLTLTSDQVQHTPLFADEDAPFILASASDATSQALRSHLESWWPLLRLALNQSSSTEAPDSPPNRPIPLHGFIAESEAMQRVETRVQSLARSHHPVLISGEGGAGKRLVAHALHALSPRSDGPLQQVACASMQHDPTEDRLFGAVADDGSIVPGAAHRADGGILLLEDVDALSLSAQERLLHLLDTGEVPHPDGTDPSPVDVRVIATTQADLDAKIRTDHVRPALRDRLCGHALTVPPLRDRRADIPLLVRHFLNTLRPSGTAVASITQPAMEALLRYRWPGNVRQLRNEIERALVYVSNDPAPVVDLDVLADPIVESAQEGASSAAPADTPDSILHPTESLDDVLARTEKTVIERVLRACDGQVTASAEMLDLTRQGLYKKMKRLNIDASTFQSTSDPAPASA